MKHKIDLHGLSIRSAVAKAESFLIEASFDKHMNVELKKYLNHINLITIFHLIIQEQ